MEPTRLPIRSDVRREDPSTGRPTCGLTQGELADRSGVTQADISRIERGSANPTEKTLCKIADALKADPCLVQRTYVDA